MANRFYIPQREDAVNYLGLATKLYDIKKSASIADQRTAILKSAESRAGVEADRASRLNEMKFGAGGLEEQKIANTKEAIGETSRRTKVMEDAQAWEKTTSALAVRPITQGSFLQIESGLQALDKQMGVKISSATSPLVNAMKDWTKAGHRRVDVYQQLRGAEKQFKPRIMEELKKSLVKATTDGDTEKQQQIGEFANTLEDWGSFVDSVMPVSAKYVQQQDTKLAGKERSPWKVTGYDKSGTPAVLSVPQGYSGTVPLNSFNKPMDGIVREQKKQGVAVTREKMRTTLIACEGEEEARSLLSSYNQQKGNEVAYWTTTKKKWWPDSESIKFITLSKEARDAGWTPAILQKAAEDNGLTPYEVLKELGLVK